MSRLYDVSCSDRAPNSISPSGEALRFVCSFGLQPNQLQNVQMMRQYDARASEVTPKRPKMANASTGELQKEK